MTVIEYDPGSWRDPGGRVFRVKEKVYRTVQPVTADHYELVKSSGLLQKLQAKGWLIETSEIEASSLGTIAESAHCVLQHRPIDFISYPYEWCFSQLQMAALLHLDIHLEALQHDVTLIDASAYNIQFDGHKPVFIDYLSFRPYREGEIWTAHQQFCEQFLNPLILTARGGIPFQEWYRGRLEGIPVNGLRKALPLTKKFSWNIFTNVVLQDVMQNRARSGRNGGNVQKRPSISKHGLTAILTSLRNFIAKMDLSAGQNSDWQDYDQTHSYHADEYRLKKEFVARYCQQLKPKILADFGCNSGDFSEIALESGVNYVVGFDLDLGALEKAWSRAIAKSLRFLPLHQNLANPSPDQGWFERERPGFNQRGKFDGLVALAVVHHMAIRHNLPLDQIVEQLTALAPTGVIEFVPKEDPMVQQLLSLREDIFEHYSLSTFRNELLNRVNLIDEQTTTATGRTLFQYERPNGG